MSQELYKNLKISLKLKLTVYLSMLLNKIKSKPLFNSIWGHIDVLV